MKPDKQTAFEFLLKDLGYYKINFYWRDPSGAIIFIEKLSGYEFISQIPIEYNDDDGLEYYKGLMKAFNGADYHPHTASLDHRIEAHARARGFKG